MSTDAVIVFGCEEESNKNHKRDMIFLSEDADDKILPDISDPSPPSWPS